jgi:protein-L-isoaspartate(D-aspartate) O-methyltransferase
MNPAGTASPGVAVSNYRQFFAEEIQIVANLTSPTVVDALAVTPRERFLPPGPWIIRGEGDFQAPPRQTPSADPRYVHHNVAVAIDPARMLFNGSPGLIAGCIDALKPEPGARVLHVGAGLGYFTAVMAYCVGPTGRVVGIEVDEALAAGARANLATAPWVDVRHGDSASGLDESFDAILVNAGVTHPLPQWLDTLAPGGRMMLPITVAMPPGTTIGKGPMVLLTRTANPAVLTARVHGFVAIYSAIGIRDDARTGPIAAVLAKNPFAPLKHARLDPHDVSPGCWIHQPGFCLSLE